MQAWKSHLYILGASSLYNEMFCIVMLTIKYYFWCLSIGFQSTAFVQSAETEINPSIMSEMNSITGWLQVILQNANPISANMLVFCCKWNTLWLIEEASGWVCILLYIISMFWVSQQAMALLLSIDLFMCTVQLWIQKHWNNLIMQLK